MTHNNELAVGEVHPIRMIRAVLKSRNDLVYKQGGGVQLGALTILIPVAFILLGTSILKSGLESIYSPSVVRSEKSQGKIVYFREIK